MENFLNKQNKGFTILEVIIAIFFLTVGLGSAFGVIQKILSFSSITNSRLIAASLSQEGIEIVKNIRDTNYIEGDLWDDGIIEVHYEVDYNDNSLTECFSDCDFDDMEFLKIDTTFDNEFYNYDLGALSKFKRKITISKEDLDGDEIADRLKITATVEWDEKSGRNSFVAHEYIYDWK